MYKLPPGIDGIMGGRSQETHLLESCPMSIYFVEGGAGQALITGSGVIHGTLGTWKVLRKTWYSPLPGGSGRTAQQLTAL